MRISSVNAGQRRREGAATVEMAMLLPLVAFLLVITIDFARIFYYSQTINNCARNGALYQSDSYVRAESLYSSLEEAALADASNLNDPENQPNVTSSSGIAQDGTPYVEVTVSYEFKTITNFPGVPSLTLARTVRMAQAPLNPGD